MPTAEAADLLESLGTLSSQAQQYFESLPNFPRTYFSDSVRDHYWSQISAEDQAKAASLVSELVDFAQRASLAARRSPLLGQAELISIGHSIKAMRAAIHLRRYRHWDTDVLHDEGRVLGVTPAGYDEDSPTHPYESSIRFSQEVDTLRRVLELVGPGESGSLTADIVGSRAPGVRPGTAFIMMSMQSDSPELDDVCDTVKRCFDRFGIQAARADDIEHEDVITKRIIDQIRSAEFLFADLSGERPSVYYEVGFAHALQRRVILFRKRGTVMHFDLAGYNCPEYENLRSLEDQLTRRLESVTGRRGDRGGGEV